MTSDWKERRRRRVKRIRLLIAGTAVLMLILLLALLVPSGKKISAADYFGLTEENQVGICAGTEKSETCGRIIDGNWYIDYESIRSFSRAVWYDEEEKLAVAVSPVRKTVLDVSGGRSEDGEVVIADGILYIAVDFLLQAADIEVTEYQEPYRIYVTEKRSYTAETVTFDAPVRQSPNIHSGIVTQLAEGDEVRTDEVTADGAVTSEKNRGWTKVATPDGFVGYIRDSALENPHEAEADYPNLAGEYTRIQLDEPVNMVFHQVTDQATNNALSEALEGVSGVNVIAPTWFFLDSGSGEITSLADSTYVENAHAAGLMVWAVLNDFDGAAASAEETAEFLSHYSSRAMLIDRVMEELRASGADGLNLDFELVTRDSAPAYIEFIRELSVELRNEGMTLSIDNYVPTYTGYMQRGAQAEAADYIVVMCYDEHTSGSEEAGSVSSLSFVEKGIEDTLKEVPREQVIAAIPFFTRLWITEKGGTPESKAYGMESAEAALAEYGMTSVWDEKTGQYYAESEDGDLHYEMWLETVDSIAAKMGVIRRDGCAGAAEWKLGLEKAEVWEIIETGLSAES